MTERAQALEALRQEIDWMLGGVGGTDSLTWTPLPTLPLTVER